MWNSYSEKYRSFICKLNANDRLALDQLDTRNDSQNHQMRRRRTGDGGQRSVKNITEIIEESRGTFGDDRHLTKPFLLFKTLTRNINGKQNRENVKTCA